MFSRVRNGFVCREDKAFFFIKKLLTVGSFLSAVMDLLVLNQFWNNLHLFKANIICTFLSLSCLSHVFLFGAIVVKCFFLLVVRWFIKIVEMAKVTALKENVNPCDLVLTLFIEWL